MGIPLWRHHPYNPDNWKKGKVKSEPEPAAATQPRSIIRRATVRDPRTSATRRRERNIDASFEEFERETRRSIAEANAETSRPETRHGEQDEHSLLDDFPPLRRMPGRMFRTRTLRSPPPPPPPASSRQLPPWRGNASRSNGLGDRERSWSPGEDHWQMELSTLEPLENPILGDTDPQPTTFTMEDSEVRAIVTRLQQCADQITGIFESLRTRTANARLSTTVESQALETLRHRLEALEETEDKLNELENYFDVARTHLEGLRDGSDQSDQSLTQAFLVNAMPALRGLLEDLDNMSNNFDSIWSTTTQSGNTTAAAVVARPEVASAAVNAAAASASAQQTHTMLVPLQLLMASTLQITRQCGEMHEQLKSWRELFHRPSLEAQLATFNTTMERVEALLAEAQEKRGRASRLLSRAQRQGMDVDPDVIRSELGWNQQELESLKTRMETVQGMYRALNECVHRSRSTLRTNTTMTGEA